MLFVILSAYRIAIPFTCLAALPIVCVSDLWDLKKPKEFDKKIRELRKEMERSAKELNFKLAATFRDQIKKMKEIKLTRS